MLAPKENCFEEIRHSKKLRFAVNQKSAISTFAHKPNLINCYMKNEDIRSITRFTKLSDWFFLSFHACILPFFCSCVRFNRQENLLHFDLKLPFHACLASNSSKHQQQQGKGNNFSLLQLFQGSQDRASSFLRLTNTSSATHNYAQDGLNALVTVFSKT